MADEPTDAEIDALVEDHIRVRIIESGDPMVRAEIERKFADPEMREDLRRNLAAVWRHVGRKEGTDD